MKYRVLVHTPAGSIQHIISSEGEEGARAKALRAHPTAELIEVLPERAAIEIVKEARA